MSEEILIDSPGTYYARNGEMVIVEKILKSGKAAGRISRTKPSGKISWVETVWGRNGRQFKLHEHGEDVVRRGE